MGGPLSPEGGAQKRCRELEVRDREIVRLVKEQEAADMQRQYIDFVTYFVNEFIFFYEEHGTMTWANLQRLIRAEAMRATIDILPPRRGSPLQGPSLEETKARLPAYLEANFWAKKWGTTYARVELLLQFWDLYNDSCHSDKKSWEVQLKSCKSKQEVLTGFQALVTGLDSLPKGFETYKDALHMCLKVWAKDMCLEVVKPLHSRDPNRGHG